MSEHQEAAGAREKPRASQALAEAEEREECDADNSCSERCRAEIDPNLPLEKVCTGGACCISESCEVPQSCCSQTDLEAADNQELRVGGRSGCSGTSTCCGDADNQPPKQEISGCVSTCCGDADGNEPPKKEELLSTCCGAKKEKASGCTSTCCGDVHAEKIARLEPTSPVVTSTCESACCAEPKVAVKKEVAPTCGSGCCEDNAPAAAAVVQKAEGGGCGCCEDDEGDAQEMPTLWLSLPGSQGHAADFAQQASQMRGVVSVMADDATCSIGITFDPAITGPRRVFEQFPDGDVEVYHPRETRVEQTSALVLLLICVLLTLPLVVIAFILKSFPAVKIVLDGRVFRGVTVDSLLGLFFATPVVFIGGWQIYLGAITAIRRKTLNVLCLITLSVGVAYLYSIAMIVVMIVNPKLLELEAFFETPAVLLSLVLLGRLLESQAISKTKDVISSLKELQEQTALLADGTELPVELIEVGDLINVLPGARIVTDGFVVSGSSTVDESLITGEAIPVGKVRGDSVLGGTINQTGNVTIQVEKIVARSTLSRVIQLVSAVQKDKVPAQLLADRISTYFVPGVLALAAITFTAWMAVTRDTLLSVKFAITVLVISCPCGIALAVPSAVVVATGVAARLLHTLVKGGATYEAARRVNTVIFDKTGTLTTGDARVASFQGDLEALAFMYAAEIGSEHVLGKALTNYCEERGVPTLAASDFQAVIGKGVQCEVEQHQVAVGSQRLMEDVGVDLTTDMHLSAATSAHTLVYVAVDGQCVGTAVISDTIREEARHVVDWLQARDFRVLIVSGDRTATVREVGKQLGIPRENCVGDNLPKDKYDVVLRLQAEGAIVAMVGDGINDSIALAAADVGVSMGVKGTDVARDASDAVFLADSVTELPALFHLSTCTFRVIAFNFIWSFAYNLLGMLVASGAFYTLGFSIHPALAGASEIVATLPVLLASISMRLWYRPPVLVEDTRKSGIAPAATALADQWEKYTLAI